MKLLGLPLLDASLNINDIGITVVLKDQEKIPEFIGKLNKNGIESEELPFPEPEPRGYVIVLLNDDFDEKKSDTMGSLLVQYADKIEIKIYNSTDN